MELFVGRSEHTDKLGITEDGLKFGAYRLLRGSFNAVRGFLMKLGVRWYMPCELGEVVPKMKSITLPKIDETVKPDFEMRRLAVRGGVDSPETTRWMSRFGVRDNEITAAVSHSLSKTARDQIAKGRA